MPNVLVGSPDWAKAIVEDFVTSLRRVETVSDLPRYVCHKEVQAARILGWRETPDGRDLTLDGSTILPVSIDWILRHQPHIGGYVVIYQDGYTSFSPAHAFESGYTRL